MTGSTQEVGPDSAICKGKQVTDQYKKRAKARATHEQGVFYTVTLPTSKKGFNECSGQDQEGVSRSAEAQGKKEVPSSPVSFKGSPETQ